MKLVRLCDDSSHKWYMFMGEYSNHYAVIDNDEVVLIDPGSIEVFPKFLSSLTETLDLKKITKIIFSYHAPDVMSSISLWQLVCPMATIYVPEISKFFLKDYSVSSVEKINFLGRNDSFIHFGNNGKLKIISSHKCPSPGSITVFDEVEKILYSADIGLGIMPFDGDGFVQNFEAHISCMETFHLDWMPSNHAKSDWLKTIKKNSPRLICPRRGKVFKDEMSVKFLDWFDQLRLT